MKCRYCNSDNFIKWGKRKNNKRTVQTFRCINCKKRFSDSFSFIRTNKSEETVSRAMYLYFDGLSLRKISRYINTFSDVSVSHSTIHSWIMEYVEVIKRYLDTFIVDAYSTWQIDEMMINIKGEQFWLWNIIDEKTRFLLCTRLSRKRSLEDAVRILESARSITQRDPGIVITDGYQVYKRMFKDVFGENSKTAYHKWGSREKKLYFNNFVERLNGSIREKVKVTRAYKELYAAQTIIYGWQIHYNFVRYHSSINQTPAEKAGLKLDLGKDKWLGLIRQSNNNQKEVIQ